MENLIAFSIIIIAILGIARVIKSINKKSSEHKVIEEVTISFDDKIYQSFTTEGTLTEIKYDLDKFLSETKGIPVSVTTTQLHKEYSRPNHYALILIYKIK